MPPSPLPKPAAFDLPQALAQALAAHHQGRLAEAERLYAAILAERPDHFDALQMQGMIKLAKGEAAEALRLVSAAMRQRKPSPQILLNYGMILHALERSEEALASFDAALKQKSKFAEAHNNRGGLLSDFGRYEEAIESLHKAIALKPDYPDAYYNLGNALRGLMRYEEALAQFDRALALKPDYPNAHHNRGIVLEMLGQHTDALACYERALILGCREAYESRGRMLLALRRADEALASYNEAVALNPANATTWCMRGRVFMQLDRVDEALADFFQALTVDPSHAEAAFEFSMAELPVIYREASEIERRRANYELKLAALNADIESGLLQGNLIKAIGMRQPFLLAYQGGNDRALQQAYGEMVARIVARKFAPAPLPPPPAPGEPIRIGIVSGFFYRHSNWKIPIKGWVSEIDRSRFRLTGYYLGTTRDAQTEVATSLFDRFVHQQLDTEGWRKEILADAPHVLIYPGLLMDIHSLQLAAQRLAPVQCNSWGHPETSGLPTLDYFLSSELMEPPGAEDHYTEKLVRLPNLSICYEPVVNEPASDGAQPITREAFGLRPETIVFWSAQSLYKYLPQYDEVFPRIASAVGDCQFVFLRHGDGGVVTETMLARLDSAFAAHGLSATDYCIFLNRLGQNEFVAAAGLSDIFLDTIGWSACNSALESLAHDLPIVTLAGPMMRGRHSAAILQMLGVTETIAETLDDYVDIAARLARDPQARRAVVDRMAASKHRLYYDRAPVTALEDFLETAVRG
jgi:protein O-GlcNAc transferase